MEVDHVQDLNQLSDTTGSEVKCYVMCPVQTCEKKIACVHKKYVRAGKKQEETENKRFRKATWYFRNLQTHLLFHQSQFEPERDNSIVSLDISLINESKICGKYDVLQTGPTDAVDDLDNTIVRDFSDSDTQMTRRTENDSPDLQNENGDGNAFDSENRMPRKSPDLNVLNQNSSEARSSAVINGPKVKDMVNLFSQN